MGFRQSKTQNGVRKQLLFQRWVSGITDDQRTEHCSDTSTGTGNTDGSSTGTNKFSSLIDIGSSGGSGDRSGHSHSESRGSSGNQLSGEHFSVDFLEVS